MTVTTIISQVQQRSMLSEGLVLPSYAHATFSPKPCWLGAKADERNGAATATAREVTITG